MYKQEACIKFVKKKMNKCCETTADIYMSLLHTRSTPISSALPSPAMLLFTRLAGGILPRFSRLPIMYNSVEGNHVASKQAAPIKQ